MSEVYSVFIRKYFKLKANGHFQYALWNGVFKITKVWPYWLCFSMIDVLEKKVNKVLGTLLGNSSRFLNASIPSSFPVKHSHILLLIKRNTLLCLRKNCDYLFKDKDNPQRHVIGHYSKSELSCSPKKQKGLFFHHCLQG